MAVQGCERAINILSLWRPQLHNTNPLNVRRARENSKRQKGSLQLKCKVFYGQEPPSGESTHRMWCQLSTTCSNRLQYPNGELLVAVDHNQLRTIESLPVDPIDWLHPPPSRAVPPERLVHSINRSGSATAEIWSCNLATLQPSEWEATTLPIRPLWVYCLFGHLAKHWPCFWNPPVPHHRIRGHQDRSKESLTKYKKLCGTARFRSEETQMRIDVRSQHRV